jgi:PAS domain S-box-containing protein
MKKASHPVDLSLSRKLRLLIIVPPCLVLALTGIVGLINGSRMAERLATREAAVEVDLLARRIEDYFGRAAMLTRVIAARQKALGPLPHPSTVSFLKSLMAETPATEAQGMYLAFEAQPIDNPDALQWVQRTNNTYLDSQSRITYDFHADAPQQEWYWGAKGLSGNQFHITEPYYDAGGARIWMMSVTRPVRDETGRLIGVAGVDLDLEEMRSVLQTLYRDETEGGPRMGEYAFLVSERGTVFALPATVKRSLGFPPLEPAQLAKLPGGAEIAESRENQVGVDVASLGRGTSRLFWKSLKHTNWKVVLSVPDRSIVAPVRQTTFRSLSVAFLGLAVMVVIAWMVANRVIEPIRRLTAAAAQVESGDYHTTGMQPIAARGDEFGQLARGFQSMVAVVAAREQELIKARQDVAWSERHYRALIENATDVVTVVGPDGLILYNSPSSTTILGLRSDESVGRSLIDFVHPEDRERVIRTLHSFDETQPAKAPFEYRFQRPGGLWSVLEAKCTDLRDDPAVGGIVVNSRDVTDRKRAEEEVRMLNAELDDRVRTRTAELLQALEELKRAKEATEQAMKQQEIFLSNVAHDLRTPLTVVIGYSQDMLRRARKKGIDLFIDDLQLVVNRGNDLLELINDMLNQSKSMSGKEVELDLKEFDVAEMVRERMEGIGAIARQYGNTIEFHPPEGLGVIRADEAKVWRILMNLITNACKFTKDGTIAVSASREADRVVLKVSDTGIGMNEGQVNRLFNRFSQVHDGSGKLQKGVGLGLSICKLYCDSMGGKLTVESQVGRGSTFTLTLPVDVRRTESPFRDQEIPPVPSRTGSRPPPPVDPASMILIIDDDISIADLIRRNLTEEGYETRTARNGEEGLRLARRLYPSAIILDVVMPGTDGWEVLRALRDDSRTAGIPVIMASMLDERERGLKMGADAYVTKPFSRELLTDLLHKHIDCQAPRVLVVEDDATTRDLLARMLEQHGFDVSAASDGTEALATLRSRPHDIVLLDLLLPTMDGFQVVDEIRNDPSLEPIPILVMTGAELGPDSRRRLQGRVERILKKGACSRDQIFREVQSFLSQKPRAETQEINNGENPLHRE